MTDIPTSQFQHYCGEIDSAVNEVIAARGGKASLGARFYDIESALGSVKFRIISKEDFDALTEKDSSTVYYVTDGSKVTQYLGDAELSGGSGSLIFPASAVTAVSHGFVSDDIIAIAEEVS